MSRTIRSALFSSFAAHILLIAANVVTVPLFLRAFGEEGYGFWGALLGFTSYLGLLNLGIAQTVSSRISTAPAGATASVMRSAIREALRTYFRVLRIAFPMAVLTSLAIPWAKWFHLATTPRIAATAAAVAVVSTFLIELPFGVFRAALLGAGEVAAERAIAMISSVARCGVAALCAALHPSLAVSVILLSAINIASSVACYLRFQRAVGKPTGDIPAEEPKQFRSASLHYFLLQVAGGMVWSTDAILVGLLIGSSESAKISVAWRLVSVVLTFGNLVAPALAPTMAQAWANGDHARARSLSREASQVVFAIVLLCSLAMAACGRELFTLWVGPRLYIGNAAWFAYCLLLVVQAFLLIPHAFVQQVGQHERYARWTMLEGVLKLGLGVLGLRFFGIAGLVIATVVARAVTTMWLLPTIYAATIDVAVADFTRAVIGPAIAPTAAFVSIVAAGRLLTPPSIPGTLAIVALATTAFAGVFFSIGAGRELRRRLVGLFLRRADASPR